MKLRKLLAALLAVCMLLTMLPVAAFAAGKTVIDISSVDGEIVVECDGIEVVYDEANKNWKGSNWELGYDQGILWLDYGEFEVNNYAGFMYIWIFPDATLADGSLGGAMVMNDGGKITGGHFENEVYNAVKEDTANNKQYVGVISGGVFDADVDNDGGKITGGTFNSDVDITGEWSADETIWFVGEIAGGIFNGSVDNDSALISGGTFNGEVENYGTIEGGTFDGFVGNFSTIEGGTFNNGVYSEGVIDAGTFNAFVDNYGEITGGTFLSESSISGNPPAEDADVTYLVKDPAEEDRTLVKLYGDIRDYTMKVKVLFADEKAPLPQKVPVNLYYQEAAPCDLTFDEPLDNYDWVVLAQGNATKANGWLYTYVFPYIPVQYNDAEEQANLEFTGYYYSIDLPKDYEVVEYGLDDENGWNTVTLKYTGKVEEPVVEEEDTYDIVVRVKFDGVDEDDIDFVNAQLLKNGKAYKKAVAIDDKDEWTHEWENLDDSSKIEWSVTADEIEGYDMEIVNIRANYWTITLSAKDAVVEKANPETGSSDFVGAAVALAVCSAVCGAALMLKRK